jgi:hypothetical protein
MKILNLFSTLLILILSGCSKDENIYSVDGEFADYLQRFVHEGNIRGVSVNTSNLILEFIPPSPGITFCAQSIPGNTPHIQIVKVDGCWTDQLDVNKELLIFHELGHALLGREHDNSTLSNGIYKTIMHSGDVTFTYSQFTPELRKYYLDQLFTPSTQEPSWAKVKTNSVSLLTDSITAATDWRFYNPYPDLKHTGTVSSIWASPGRSLSIFSPDASGSNPEGSLWYKSITPPNIAVGTELILKVKVKTENIVVGGAYITLKGFSGNETAFYVTSATQAEIKGSQNFTEYAVHLFYYPQSVDSIDIYLILAGGSSGTVYFDDVEVVNEY